VIRQRTNVWISISIEKYKVISLNYVADEGRYGKVANAFGVSRAAVSNCEQDFFGHHQSSWPKIH